MLPAVSVTVVVTGCPFRWVGHHHCCCDPESNLPDRTPSLLLQPQYHIQHICQAGHFFVSRSSMGYGYGAIVRSTISRATIIYVSLDKTKSLYHEINHG